MQQTPTPTTQNNAVIETTPENVGPLKKTGQKVSRRELEKEEKLKQKLRYLQFYESYEVEGAPESWRCSSCSQIRVSRQTIVNGCKEDVCSHEESHTKKVVYDKVLEWTCGDQEVHVKEWEGKRKTEIRPEIQKAFKKEENGWVGAWKDKAAKKCLLEQDFNVMPKQQKTIEKIAKVAVEGQENKVKSDGANSELREVKQNYHSQDCKTCVRMEKLMGNIMPHPINA